ncbi:MAG: hypothetical protein P8125_00270 [Gemmatimonadota bacterium]|jgi:adenylate cyclase
MSSDSGLTKFFAELKRRHVFRVTAVYGAASFAVLQAADILFPRLGLPEWTVTLVAALALAGFPLALILSWAYERTAEGLKKTDPARTGELEAIAAEPVGTRWPVGLAALGGIALLGFGAWWVLGRPDPVEAQTYDSIAVLPFVNMTGDEENEYLGDGLAEELLNALAGLEGLKVESRTSSFAFKGSSLGATEIGDSLDVATVLEGSVRGSGDRRRITAQLIDARDGTHIWSETYDRAQADLLDIQDDLTEQITDALAVQLATGSSPGLARPGTENPEAYDYFLQGRYFWNKRTPGDQDIAVSLFEKAIELDSSFAPAYAAIADARVVPSGWLPDAETALNKAEQYARIALDLDPALAQAHAALGLALAFRDLDFRASETSFRRAIELDPGYATGHQWYAELLSAMDRHDEAVAEAQLAESLDPTPIIRWNLSRTLYQAGRYDEAIAQVDAIVDTDPGSLRMTQAYKLLSLLARAEYDAALDILEQGGAPPSAVRAMRDSLVALGPDEMSAAFARMAERLRAPAPGENGRPLQGQSEGQAFEMAWNWALAGSDRALDYLEIVGRDPDSVNARVTWFEVLQDPVFDPFRNHPRYLALTEAFGL